MYREDEKYVILPNFHLDYRFGLTKEQLALRHPGTEFHPATFIKISGDEEEERSYAAIQSIYNHESNIEGRYIKIVVGSKVINEGISLANVGQIHMFDVTFNKNKTI